MILGRELYKNIKIGCCGLSRHDSIFPVGYNTSKEEFLLAANKMIEKYYMEEYNGGNDNYSLEYFEGTSEQENRGSGKSVFKCVLLEDDNKWHFYIENKEVDVFE
ncbi:MAG: hypothetical protein WC346_04740 [Methanogenium sp.]|jgi:hypothetical protein